MAGTLYLCATPIGNLDDITFRVLETLKNVDVIAAEDTRNSIKLLNRFEIKTPMTSYHEFNKYDKGRQLIEQLLDGKNIAVITDAGMPGISDPGEELVKMAYEAGVPVTVLPGACACVTALTLSGLPTRRFCFEAFLPTDKKERQGCCRGTGVIYSSGFASLVSAGDALGAGFLVTSRTTTSPTTAITTAEITAITPMLRPPLLPPFSSSPATLVVFR